MRLNYSVLRLFRGSRHTWKMTFIEFEIEMKFVREKLKKLVAVISEAQRRTLFRFEYNDTTD